MSTRFFGEGNIGSDPICRMFPGNGNQAPRGVLRLNVRFDNLMPSDDGMVDRGGFWANVEIWGRQVEQWASLYQRGQRVLVSGRMVQETWEKDGETQTAMKVMGDRVGILPFRVSQVVMEGGQAQEQTQAQAHQHQAPYQPPAQQQASQPAGVQDRGDDDIPF